MRSLYGMDVSNEQREAAERTGQRLGSQEYSVPLTRNYKQLRRQMARQYPEFRTTTYTSTTATAGGDVVPPGTLVERIERALLQFGGVRSVATIVRTTSGEPLEFPTSDDTSSAGELLGEVADSDDSAASDGNISTSNVTLNAYKLSSKIVRVSRELLDDSAVDFEGFIGDVLGERLGRGMATYLTTGNGSTQPNGVVTASTAGKTAASASTVTGDELIDLMHSVDPAYRQGAAWMMKDSTVQVIRKLKDSDNQYLWQSGLKDGMPDMLLGAPLVVNQQVAAIAASAKTILFGDFSKYLVRDVGGIRLVRADQRYVEYDQVGFIAFARFDGDLLDAGTNPVKYLVMAAS
jgi:HK97 family phage major capsid protein